MTQIQLRQAEYEYSQNYALMAKDPLNCKFYMKTGACRWGYNCMRKHVPFENSRTILIPNFFQDVRDSGMEDDEVQSIFEFEKFYDDVIKEFRSAGDVTMFKCCHNYVSHLRGNVYVQYTKREHAVEAMKMFNGRFYAGRQLVVEFAPVTNWKFSICQLFDKRLCEHGRQCNFLHVFRNPGNAYSVPTRTDFDPERAFKSGAYDSRINTNHPVFKYYNTTGAYGYCSTDAKPSSNLITLTQDKWDNNIKNEKSHSDSHSHNQSNQSRHHSRSRSRSHSRSPSKSASHSRSHSQNQSGKQKHSKSESRSRSQSKSRSKEHNSHSKENNSRSKEGNSRSKEGNSRSKEGNSRSKERNSHSKERNSHSKEGNSRSKEGNSHSKEGNSHSKEGNSHSKEGNSHSKEGNSHSKEGNSHSKEGNSHIKERNSRSKEGNSRSKEGNSHIKERNSHSSKENNSHNKENNSCGEEKRSEIKKERSQIKEEKHRIKEKFQIKEGESQIKEQKLQIKEENPHNEELKYQIKVEVVGIKKEEPRKDNSQSKELDSQIKEEKCEIKEQEPLGRRERRDKSKTSPKKNCSIVPNRKRCNSEDSDVSDTSTDWSDISLDE